MVDPSRSEAVAPALTGWLRDRYGPAVEIPGVLTSPGDGLTTFIWFFEPAGDGLPLAWRRPLALRIFPGPDDDVVAEREAAIHAWARRHRYPVPEVLAWGPHDDGFGLPYLVMAKAPGDTMLRAVLAAPWRARRLMRELAVLHHCLHVIPLGDDAPLAYDGALVDRRVADLAARIRPERPHLEARLALLERQADVVRAEDPIVLHNDFHPLNVLVSGESNGLTVIDWSDASIGDVHHDVARTLALFRVASIAAGSATERRVLSAAHPWLSRTYRSAYEAAAGRSLDDDRLRYWQAVHVLRGALQVIELFERDAGQASTAQSANVPASLADDLLSWFDDLAAG